MASPKPIDIFVTDTDGAPLTGLSLTWHRYRTSTDGITWSAAAGPSFVEDGGGWYAAIASVAIGLAVHGTIDCGATAGVRYVPWQARAEDWNTDTVATAAALAALQLDVDAIKAQTDLLSESPSGDGISAARLRIGATTAISIRDPLDASLTASQLRAWRMRPLIVGDDWEVRFLVLSGGVPVNLTGYDIEAVLQQPNGTAVMSRTLDVTIEDSSPSRLQLELDADQATNNGALGTEDRGWFTMRLGHEDEDAAALAAAITAGSSATVNLAIRLSPAGAAPTTWLRGVIEILKSYFPATP